MKSFFISVQQIRHCALRNICCLFILRKAHGHACADVKPAKFQIELYDEEIKENIFNVVILYCFMKKISCLFVVVVTHEFILNLFTRFYKQPI